MIIQGIFIALGIINPIETHDEILLRNSNFSKAVNFQIKDVNEITFCCVRSCATKEICRSWEYTIEYATQNHIRYRKTYQFIDWDNIPSHHQDSNPRSIIINTVYYDIDNLDNYFFI